MNNKRDEVQQISVIEKFHNCYQEVTLTKSPVPKQSPTTKNISPTSSLQVSKTKATCQPSTPGLQNETVFSNEKVPPYTNASINQHLVRVNPLQRPISKQSMISDEIISVSKTEPSKISKPGTTSNKPSISFFATTPTRGISCANKANLYVDHPQEIRSASEKSDLIAQRSVKPKQNIQKVEKSVVFSGMSGGEENLNTSKNSPTFENNKNTQLQTRNQLISSTSDVVGSTKPNAELTVTSYASSNVKNISPKSATVSGFTYTNIKDGKSANVGGSKMLTFSKHSPMNDILKNVSKSVYVQPTTTERVLPANNISKSPTIIKSAELASKNIPKVGGDAFHKTVSPKLTISTVPMDSSAKADSTKNEAELCTKTILPKATTVMSTVVKNIPKTAVSVSGTPQLLPKTQTFSDSIQIQTVPVSGIANSRRFIVPVSNSIFTDLDSNKELLEALNSGSNIKLTDSVTISNQLTPTVQLPLSSSVSNSVVPLVILQTVADPKIRNVTTETTIQSIPKQVFNAEPKIRNVTTETTIQTIATQVANADSKPRNVTNETTIQTITKQVANADPKIRNVTNETTIQNISKQANTSYVSTSNTRIKNENIFEIITSEGDTITLMHQDIEADNSNSSFDESLIQKCEASSSVMLPDSNEKSGDENTLSRRKQDEPECLTISSDDEGEETEQFISSYSDTSDVSVSIMSKEPRIQRDESSVVTDEDEKEKENMLEMNMGEDYINLECRTIRIGSYKIPQSSATVAESGLRIAVPAIYNAAEEVVLKIPIKEISKVLAHFGRSLPVIFYYVSPQIGAKIRNALKMTNSGHAYFDPTSDDESHRRITLLPEKLTDSNKMDIKEIYTKHEIFAELNHQEANQLLVQSSPKNALSKSVKNQVPSNPVQTIMVFPPPPAKGGISINTEDYSCLMEDVFLNDVIIDFYLKYLYHKQLSDEDKENTHIFSSFFYKRLTDKATPVSKHLQNSKNSDSAITAAEIRHSRVKNWTKNIDLFSKDYIVIPLNENQHWFLAIICFPGLKGPVRFSDNSPIADDPKDITEIKIEHAEDSDENNTDNKRILRPTIVSVKSESRNTFCVDEDNDSEDRDEADGADEDVNFYYSSSEESDGEFSESEITETGEIKNRVLKRKPEREPIKQPCILIFDSLAGASRAKIIATLRDYLRVEYKLKHGEDRDFSKNVVKGACPKVPQQTNYTDCGLYVLQYVESFFAHKITDFHLPIKTLREWFYTRLVSNKRYFIQQLLHSLMTEQQINVDNLNLPDLHLSARSISYEDSDEFERYDVNYFDDPDDEAFDGYDENMEEMEEHARYNAARAMNPDLDDSEFMDEEEEHELYVGGRSRYNEYTSSDDESHEIEAKSEDDEQSESDLYNDLDELGVVQGGEHYRVTRMRRRVKNRGSGVKEYEEAATNDHDHDEEEELEEDVDPEDERFIGLNKENVTISRMPSCSSSTVTKSGQTSDSSDAKVSSSSTLAQLKAARPWGRLENQDTNTGCSTKKRFRTS